MERFIYISCILTTLFALANCARIQDVDPPMYAPSMSPSTPDSPDIPTSDCSDVIFAMADCVPFISEGSKATKPDGSCCPGLKMVLKAGDDCLCEAIESSTDLGISINMTLALSLPSACGISDNSAFRQCDLPLPPGASIAEGPPPKPSPKKSQSPKAQRAPATSPVNVVPAPAVAVPAPVPAHSGTYSTSASLVLILSMVTASFYSVAF